MAWKGTALPVTESRALEESFPLFRDELMSRGIKEFAVGDYIAYLDRNPHLGMVGFQGSIAKRDVAARNPGKVVINAQNALYHLSASSPNYVIHDAFGGQVTLLRRVGNKQYELV